MKEYTRHGGKQMKTVAQIVREYLDVNGYDGLYNVDGECGCTKDDLAPCCEMSDECIAGYLLPLSDGSEYAFVIGSRSALAATLECAETAILLGRQHGLEKVKGVNR